MSPKNKGKFGKGKPSIETEDEFVSGVNQFLQKLKPYAKQLLIGLVVLLWGGSALKRGECYLLIAIFFILMIPFLRNHN